MISEHADAGLQAYTSAARVRYRSDAVRALLERRTAGAPVLTTGGERPIACIFAVAPKPQSNVRYPSFARARAVSRGNPDEHWSHTSLGA